ncbi:hypothetical protein GCM10022381_25330 [Leifsonia kafniensis]|uniref:Transposase n=1 Tax=Leifsonia kafniensis TaxID=475957 RepID=A0ABP7KPN9_9MICO
MQLTDPVAGQLTRVFLFVGCVPFSRYAFVEPTPCSKAPGCAQVAMFDWFGGSVPRVMPDNLKTGVIKHPEEGEAVLNKHPHPLAS